MSDGFYRAFEDRYRGSRELIKSRLNIYLPFVQPLLQLDVKAKAVDLGCGRGEWLELISGLGFEAVGVDLDQGMLAACHELGLKVEKRDALNFLEALPKESQTIISAFHVVEHVTFEQLQRLVSQALRVLKPGGLLIMETPNPKNIVVATRNFYLDPTHLRPIPPELLSFFPVYHGFGRTKILRLLESKALAQRTELTLQDVLGGASPDYAVVAQKAAAESYFSLLDTPFSLEYGLSLESLTARYQNQISARLKQAETKACQAENKARQAEDKARQAEDKARQAETASNERIVQLQAVYASSSWRLTEPLRAIKRFLGGDFSIFRRSTAVFTLKAKQLLRPAIANGIGYVLKHPKLKGVLSPILRICPWLRRRLFRVAVNAGVFGGQKLTTNNASSGLVGIGVASKLQAMTPRARQIYFDLKAAVDVKIQENC